MLGFFPRVAEDELLYSVLARLNRRLGGFRPRQFEELISGIGDLSVPAFFQQNVQALVDNLPPASTWTCDEFIWDHMMVPYFSPFVLQESLDGALRDIMYGGSGAHLHLGWRTTAYGQLTLRCCDQCYQEDAETLGEGVWRRIHQCPPAVRCPKHDVPLLDTGVPLTCRNRQRRDKWLPLTEEVVTKARPLKVTGPPEFHMRLARESQWLLDNKLKPQPREEICRRYRLLAEKGGWIGHAGRPDWTGLGYELMRYVGSDFLRQFGLDLTGYERSNWIKRTALVNARGSAPVRHLILVCFLDLTLEEFLGTDLPLDGIREAGAEGETSPCKNIFCDLYQAKQRPRGVIRRTLVRCPECGFAYRFGAGGAYSEHIEEPGKVWIRGVRRLRREACTWGEINEETGITIAGFQKLKRRYKLDADEFGASVQDRRRKARIERKRRKHREWLLKFRRENPSCRRTEIVQSGRGPCAWLFRNDGQWFEENLPPKVEVDWGARDTELLSEIEVLSEEIRSRYPAVRVTKNQLVERAVHGWCLQKKPKEVPKSMHRMAELVESQSEFEARCRRIGSGDEPAGPHPHRNNN